jgi:hypothetical protein
LPPERLDEYMNTFHNIKQQLQHWYSGYNYG